MSLQRGIDPLRRTNNSYLRCRLIPINKLENFIKGMINNKYAGNSKSSLAYLKPYSRRKFEDACRISSSKVAAV